MTQVIETTIAINTSNVDLKASLILSEHTGLPQSKIKVAMQKGAVWLCRGNEKKRLRRASKPLKIDDTLEINYNEAVLNQAVAQPLLVHDALEYSVWFKPYGLACQGSRWGDFATINRWVEINLPDMLNCPQRPVMLVHRLDRATSGLMLLCHTKNAARLFSEMFQSSKLDKRYQAIVHGDFSANQQSVEVNIPVEGRHAKSEFSFAEKNDDYSLLDITLFTGRKHQIRQHLKALNYPIVGDRLYGGAATEEQDLQLQSVSLSFMCPISSQEQHFEVDEKLRLTL